MIEKKEIDQEYKYGFSDGDNSILNTNKGLSVDVIKKISSIKNEPEWMLNLRLKAYEKFLETPNPTWGADLSNINYDDIIYYTTSSKKMESYWEKVPQQIKETFEKLGIPEAEAKFLNGVSAQYDSETVYKKLEEELEQKGVIFTNIEKQVSQRQTLPVLILSKGLPSLDFLGSLAT